MVFKGVIDPKTKAFVRFLREERHVTIKEISKRCGISLFEERENNAEEIIAW